ncbi:hypothetical protein EDD11_009615 [Mortierella claussenii]|nr:hypothetical protein EDD11_009615 [Mortierella claussenii]
MVPSRKVLLEEGTSVANLAAATSKEMAMKHTEMVLYKLSELRFLTKEFKSSLLSSFIGKTIAMTAVVFSVRLKVQHVMAAKIQALKSESSWESSIVYFSQQQQRSRSGGART